MAKDKVLLEQGFDREKWKKLQELTTKLANWQEQALKMPCPYCQGKLGRNDIGSVHCPSCGKVYNCQSLVESQTIILDI